MKILNSCKVALGALLALGALSAHAALVGKVIAAAGETQAVRQGKEVTLTVGAPVESGDMLKVGEPGNLQVRFNDEAIVALRSNSQLRIDDYKFEHKPESDSSILSLLKGGMRTITGIIGHLNKKNYAVNTPTSTIGIRGTHYTLVQCDNDCRNADGSTAANGTFGGVTDGRISVTNDAGEREFGKNEFFFVASRTALPASLLAPPSFLRDRLEGQAKASGKGQTSGAAKEESTASASSSTSASSVPQAAAESPTQQLPQVTTVVVSEQPVITQQVVNPFVGYTDFAVAGSNYASAGSFEINTQQMDATTRVAEVQRLQEIYPQALALSTDTGYDAAIGEVHWGRWFGTGGTMGGFGEHWAVGIPTPYAALPTSGSYTYNWVGGTHPMDNNGNVGTLTSGGSLLVDFTSRTVNSVTPISWSVGGHSYTLTVAGIVYASSGIGTKTLTCDGCTSSSVDISGQFTGNTGEGIVTGIYTSATFSNGEVQQTGSAQVYGRYTPPATNSGGSSSTTNVCASYPCTYSSSYVDAESQRSTYTSTGSTTTSSTSSWASAGWYQTIYNSAPSTSSSSSGSTTSGVTQTYTTTAPVDVGSDPVANLHWDRYSYSSTVTSSSYSSTTDGWNHNMWGDATTTLPSSGNYTYNWIGGTSPTDAAGNVGTLTNGGSWTVNFTDKSVATATPVTWNLNGVSYNLSVPTQTLTWTTSSYSDPAGAYTSSYGNVNPITNFSVSCNPSCSMVTVSGNGNTVSPWFFGSNAEAMGVGYSTVVDVGGVTHNSAHVQAYKR